MEDEGEKIDLLPEEWAYLHRGLEGRGRCKDCGHLVIFHLYHGGSDACAIWECHCYI
jgi:hypothetical protein